MWDEFDEFFDFAAERNEQGITRDDTRGADYKTNVELEFEDALSGKTVEVEMNKRIICHTCRGTRAAPKSNPRKCYECGGRGSIVGNYGIKKRC